MEKALRLPLGVQDFEILRSDNYLYVDKTELIYELVKTQRSVFLSRPRRFGKSLLISTIRYYFLGEKALFTGLAMERLEKDWTAYPVMYFSLAGGEFTKEDGLRTAFQKTLLNFENDYGLPHEEPSLSIRFANALENAFKKTGRRVVVLVDEYDNPLLKTMTVHPQQEEANRELYKAFFATLKDYDRYLQFYLFTGVTKFSKVSIFSDLNQLTDISLQKKYNNICGISQSELESNFGCYIDRLAKEYEFSHDDCIAELKRMYDGYHFSANGEGMYNPYSLIHSFDEERFSSYWFESGTPTFLINKLNDAHYDIQNFATTISVTENALKDYRPENADPTPLFYQSGYLTIKDFNKKQNSYELAFPNAEVKYGFLEALAPSYLHIADKEMPFNINALDDAVESGDTTAMRNWFTALFALLPYPASGDSDAITEQNFQNVIFLALTMMGKYVRTEVHSAKGRADCILETDDYVYLFEFKRDKSAEEALAQIKEKEYAKAYAADTRRLFKIGVNFSTAERNITEWEVR